MRTQFLLSMGQDRLSKEEAGELLYQRVHILVSTQELRHSTRNFVKLVGDYLGEESPIFLLMGTRPCHVDRFKRQYEKAFAKDPLSGTDLMDRIHKTCSGVFTLLKHDRHIGHGVGVPCRVRGYSEEGGWRGLVDLDSGMGESASAKGGGTPEI